MFLYVHAIILSIFIIPCNGQSNAQQANVSGIKAEPTKQSKLDFSSITGNFDKVYSNIHSGFQDKAGNLWFGTTGAGAIQYKEKFFTHFTVKDKHNNTVVPLLEDKYQNIWFGTADGIYRYDGKNFINVPVISADKGNSQVFTLSAPLKSNSASISVISAMEDRKGNIWFGTETSGVYRFDGKNITPVLSQKGINNNANLKLNSITDIIEDRKGNIWFASWNNEGLCRYDGKSFINYTLKDGLVDNMIYSIMEDEKGNIWIGTRNHGVWRYNGKSFTDISKETALKNESIYSIIQDEKGSFWFATQSKGVWHYDGKTFTNFTTKDGLSNNSVFCIIEEKNGNLWFGTRGLGLTLYDGKTFTTYTTN